MKKGKIIYTPEKIEERIKTLSDELKRFPLYNEINKKCGKWFNDCIKKRYPGGRKALAVNLGFSFYDLNTKLADQLKEDGKIDPYGCKAAFMRWKLRNSKKIDGISDDNSKIIIDYISECEIGLYTKGRKKMGYARLEQIARQIVTIAKIIEREFQYRKITELNRNEVHTLFNGISNGHIKSHTGKVFDRPSNIQKEIIAFWNHYARKCRMNGCPIENIVQDLTQDKCKNTFVYFTLDQLKAILSNFTEDEQTLLLFCFDSIVRAPKELSNILVRDVSIENGEVFVKIREEIAKTYERKFNLVLCGEQIKKYLARHKLFPHEPLFKDIAFSVSKRLDLHRKIQKAFIEKFGDDKTLGGESFSKCSLYSFRHSGACYLRSLDIPLDKLLIRGGWSGVERLNYYTRFLGQTGKISIEQDNKLLQTIEAQNIQITKLTETINRLTQLLIREHKPIIEV